MSSYIMCAVCMIFWLIFGYRKRHKAKENYAGKATNEGIYRTKKLTCGVTIRSDKAPVGWMLLYGIAGALMIAGSIALIFMAISEGDGAIFIILIALLVAG